MVMIHRRTVGGLGVQVLFDTHHVFVDKCVRALEYLRGGAVIPFEQHRLCPLVRCVEVN